ncbi:ABC-type transport auxiliary lipoprotein family protein [Dokdonella sp.]|uniref:ABC-type transport auxiliary lipoprotein family protein n=1 Tax=Dokdonella sp. TaxID=2291710 RepID=UPI0031C81AD6|nr:ABC-type transport auxiliary lipoprotein family protein [Dokdonella sp.]
MNALTRRLVLLIVALPVLAGGGCSSMLGGKPQAFTLYAPAYTAADATRAGPKVDWQLVVETPIASDALSTARLLAVPAPGVIEVFPDARWRDPAPAMLRDLIVQAFEESGRILGVGGSATNLRGDYALSLELRALQADFADSPPHALVSFRARLLDFTSNRVLAARSFQAVAPLQGRDSASAFAALQVALNEVLPQLVDWTLEQGAQARSQSPAP